MPNFEKRSIHILVFCHFSAQIILDFGSVANFLGRFCIWFSIWHCHRCSGILWPDKKWLDCLIVFWPQAFLDSARKSFIWKWPCKHTYELHITNICHWFKWCWKSFNQMKSVKSDEEERTSIVFVLFSSLLFTSDRIISIRRMFSCFFVC